MIIDNYVAELLLRKKKKEGKITYLHISTATGISVSTIGRIVRNSLYQIKHDSIVKLCKYFDVEVDDLVKFKPFERRNSCLNSGKTV